MLPHSGAATTAYSVSPARLNLSPPTSFLPGCLSTSPFTVTSPSRTKVFACPPVPASPEAFKAWAREMEALFNSNVAIIDAYAFLHGLQSFALAVDERNVMVDVLDVIFDELTER